MNAPHLDQLSPEARHQLESLLYEFEQNWTGQLLAATAEKLGPDHPLRQAALIELVKIDLERRWQAGRKVLLDSYLKRYPELGSAYTVPADLILAEFRIRHQFGATADPAEYARRFPRQAPQLQRLIARMSEGAPTTTPRDRPAAEPQAEVSTSRRSPATVRAAPAPAAPAPAAPAPAGGAELPERFGRYRIIKQLGAGGMGRVYLAHDDQLDRQVALKVPHFLPTDGSEVLERFRREARAAAVIDHPNICPVYDVGERDGVHFVTMAYVEGKPLSEVIRGSAPLPLRPVVAIVRKLALAMQEAHAHGVIHRDLKPSNVMVNRRKEPVIMDFGLARRASAEDSRLTKSGSVLGTPAYMAPEQVAGDVAAMGPGCDIYSLGVILYELSTGRVPFQGPVMSVLAMVITQEPEPPSKLRPEVDAALEAICLKAMAKRPADRYASMAAMAAALEQYLKNDRAGAAAEPAAKGRPAPRTATPQSDPAVSEQHLATQLLGRLLDRLELAPRDEKPQRTRWWGPVAAVAVLLVLVMGILYVVVPRGAPTVTVENNVVVSLKGLPHQGDPTVIFVLDGRVVSRDELDKPMSLRIGDHELIVKRGDRVLDTTKFSVGKDDKEVAPFEAAVADTGPDPKGEKNPGTPKPGEWVQLFNGKNLDGWSTWPQGTVGWEVKDGVLGSTGALTPLYSDRGDYKNFHFRVEAMVNDRGKGVQFGRALFRQGTTPGVGAMLNSTASDLKTGSLIYSNGGTWSRQIRQDKTPIKPDTWFTQELIADGNHIIVKVNGEVTADFLETEKRPAQGFLALYREDRDTVVKFRKIEVKELPPERPVVRPGREPGWVQLFNRKDLAGWKVFPSGTTGWQVKDGVLSSTGPLNHLYSERGDYENFHFRVEAMVNDRGKGVQFGRARFDKGPTVGIGAMLNSTASEDKTGSLLYSHGGVWSRQIRQEDTRVKPDMWFTQELIVDGNNIIVKVNGQVTAEHFETEKLPPSGFLALYREDQDTVVKFRCIEIKELPPTKK
jgi:predicted Ser/Thr protein kinase